MAAEAQIPNSPMQGNVELRMNDVKVNPFCDELSRLVITVIDADNVHLDRQAVVKLHDKKRDITTWETTSDQAEVTFCNIDFGDYELDVSAVGYQITHKEWHIAGAVQERDLKIVLRPDPMAVNLNTSDGNIPPKARSDMKHAVAALKSGNLKEGQRRLEKVSKLAPSSPQVNFLYGYLFMQRKDFAKAESYLKQAATQDPQNAKTLTLLGRMQLERKENEDSQETLERAVQVDSNYWMAHYLLGDAYLRLREQEKAREQAQLAIDQGKKSASLAQLVLGQALANVGRYQEGIQALTIFVQTNAENTAVPQVKALIANLEKRAAGRSIGELHSVADLALAASTPSLPESSWGPPGVDDVQPAVVPGVSCPSQQVIDATSERVKELGENITKFAAIEDLLHEQLDKFGRPISKESRKFNYVASITEDKPGLLETTEYRDLKYGLTDLPDHIVTTGFVTLALIFHPAMRDSYDMACEGLGDWRGRPAWLVHFQQRDDKPNRFAEYIVGNDRYPVMLKGRAWVATDNLQIVRIESDLARSLPQLPVEHQIAEYGPVHFQQKNVDLWLPQSVDIYLELNRHFYYRRHSFDHYMLFSVNAEDKAKFFSSPPESPVMKDVLPSNPVPNH